MKHSHINLHRLKNFPISFFSLILGLAGFTIVLQRIETLFNFSRVPSSLMMYFVTFLFLLLLSIYIFKVFLFREDVIKEFNNPIKINFFPTISISLLLISILYLPIQETISQYLWIVGAILHFIFTLLVLTIWFQHSKFEYNHFNPAWFIPIVGNIVIPLAGLEHFSHEISWFFFSIGIIFWIVLFTIFVNRIIFHQPLLEKLLPTLFILIAPPAIACISLVKLGGELSESPKILYYFALFLTFFLIAQFRIFSKIQFYLSWWAYSFPIAAITLATYTMYEHLHIEFFKYLFTILSIGFLFLIVMLVIKTLIAIKNNQICIEE